MCNCDKYSTWLFRMPSKDEAVKRQIQRTIYDASLSGFSRRFRGFGFGLSERFSVSDSALERFYNSSESLIDSSLIVKTRAYDPREPLRSTAESPEPLQPAADESVLYRQLQPAE